MLEFVEDGATGLVTSPDPQAIARSITPLMSDAGEAERLGRAGRERVAGITWDGVVDALLGTV